MTFYQSTTSYDLALARQQALKRGFKFTAQDIEKELDRRSLVTRDRLVLLNGVPSRRADSE